LSEAVIDYLNLVFLCIAEHSGPPDPLHGSAPYLSVRQEAKVRRNCC